MVATFSYPDLSPAVAARELLARHEDDPGWLDAFGEALDRGRRADGLNRVLSVWALSQADLGELLGVSRQAVGKWLERGIPPERAPAIADLAAAADLLVRYLKRDRISAVVRRPAANLGGESLLSLAGQGRTGEALVACRTMFDAGAVTA